MHVLARRHYAATLSLTPLHLHKSDAAAMVQCALQVRNAANNIVQLSYGDDGLDPVCMEGKNGEPIDFGRALSQVKADTPSVKAPDGAMPAAAAPLPAELQEMLTQRLKLRGLVADSNDYSGKFVESLEQFVQQQVLSLMPLFLSLIQMSVVQLQRQVAGNILMNKAREQMQRPRT